MTRILVARMDSMGDVLVCGPAVRALAAGPDVEWLGLLCGPPGEQAARLLPGPDEVHAWAAPWILATPPPVGRAPVEDLIAWVSDRRIDEAVILTSFHQSPLPLALLLRLAGVGRIVGVSTDYAGSLLDVRLRPGEDLPENQPETVRALRIAEAAGHHLPPGDDGRLRIRNPDGAISGGTGGAVVGPYLVLHPGASAPARAWPPERCREAVELLAGRGHRVVVTGGPDETALTARVAGTQGIDMGGLTDLARLADLVAGASVLICGNTGPAHLAAAVGTPVVSLFSPVVPTERWAPYGVAHELLGDRHAACAGSRARICPVPGHPCLTSVTAHDVVAAVQRLLRVRQEGVSR